MTNQMKSINEEMKRITATGNSGGGMVLITINGLMNVVDIDIDNALLNEENKTTLLTLLISAFNNAVENINTKKEEEIKNSLSKMGLGF